MWSAVSRSAIRLIVILSLQDRFLGSTFHPLDCVVVDSRCDTNRESKDEDPLVTATPL